MVAGEPRAHHEIRAPALLGVGHLPCDGGIDLGLVPPPPRPQARRLDRTRCRDDDDEIGPPLAAGFEQQRHIQHHGTDAGAPGAGEKATLGGAHQRMHDALQAPECPWFAHHRRAQGGAVDDAVADRAGKRCRNRPHRAPTGALQCMHGGVGIEHRNPGTAKTGGGGGFAHADAAGEPDHAHPGSDRRQIVADEAAQRLIDLGIDAEPGGEPGTRLL